MRVLLSTYRSRGDVEPAELPGRAAELIAAQLDADGAALPRATQRPQAPAERSR